MARVAPVLGIIARSALRNSRAVGAFLGNNFFVIIVVLMAEEPKDRPSSTSLFFFLIGLLYAIPLAGDLTLRIPAERFALWPLSRMERGIAYAVNLALNPLLLVAIVFAALSRHPAVKGGLLVSGIVAPLAVYAVRFVVRRMGGNRLSGIWRVPRFPGRLGGLVQNHLREHLRMLDVYFAAALSIGGLAYRLVAPNMDPLAAPVISHLIVIIMSTLAQAHLALDGDAAETRSRLLPVSGMAVLFVRDAAWLSIVGVLVAWHAPLSTASAALTALMVGHHAATRPLLEQRRGRFGSGTLAPIGIAQIVGVIVAGVTTRRFGLSATTLWAGAYFVSLLWYGRKWEKACALGTVQT